MLPHKRPALAMMTRLMEGAGGEGRKGNGKNGMTPGGRASLPPGTAVGAGSSIAAAIDLTMSRMSEVAPVGSKSSGVHGVIATIAPQRPPVEGGSRVGVRRGASGLPGQGVIEQHFLSSHCALCDDQTLQSQTLCRRCLSDPQVRERGRGGGGEGNNRGLVGSAFFQPL